jgi:outer membrane usher protein
MPVLAPAWLDLVVNGVPKATVLVHLSGAEAWIAVDDLERAGLKVDGGDRIEHAGRSLVSLASLAPAITFLVDEAGLAVRVTAKQALLGRTRLDLYRLERPAGLLHREAPSAFLNWAVSGDSDRRRTATSELGVAVGPALLLSGATMDRTNGLVRGLTTASWDDRKRLVRASAGDVMISPGDPLAGTGLVLGGSFGRELSLDPYLIRAPYPRTSVFASTPATLEVWIDDALVRRTQVAPGTIDLENLPVNAGLSEIRTVLRDAFGREESASTFALMGSSTLPPGLLDWGVAAGARRERFGLESFAYGGPLGQARVRGGITRILTVGGRAEAGNRLLSGGVSGSVATRIGELEATAAASVDDGEPGSAALLAWRRTGRRGGIVAQLRWDSGRYANGSLPAELDRSVLRGTLTGSVPLARRVSLLGELAGERRRDTDDAARTLARVIYTLPGGFHSGLSASRTFRANAPDSTELLVTLSLPVAGGARAEVQGTTDTSGNDSGQLSVTRSMRPGPDIGYRLVGRGGDGALAEAAVQAQARVARAEVDHLEIDPWTGARTSYTSAQLSSGLVLLDGRVFATRPVDGSYALVRVEGAPGVRVLLEGQDAGRTDGDGELLVTGLQPYLGNRLSIRDSDVPLDFRVDEVERVVAPRNHGGTVERFRIARQRAVTGRMLLVIDGWETAPEWGEVAVELAGKRAVSPIGSGGAFWLEGIPPGAHDGLIRWEGRLCRFSFEVGEEAGTVDLGKVRCVHML